nr:MAG TPA: hypothetical protein [Caudoviricetes sp.]
MFTVTNIHFGFSEVNQKNRKIRNYVSEMPFGFYETML